MPGLALVGYDLDLNKAAGGELGYLEAGTAGEFRAEVIPVDPVHGREVVEVDQRMSFMVAPAVLRTLSILTRA